MRECADAYYAICAAVITTRDAARSATLRQARLLLLLRQRY